MLESSFAGALNKRVERSELADDHKVDIYTVDVQQVVPNNGLSRAF